MEKNIPDEVRKQIEEGVKELAKKSTAPDKETPDWMETDIRRGAEFGYFLACNSSHPEQGEQGELIHLGESDGNVLHNSFFQEQGELYRWVKCKDEPPSDGNCFRIPWTNPYNPSHKEWIYFNGGVDEYDKVYDVDSEVGDINQDTVEWLCKLSSPPPEGQDWEELYKSACESYREAEKENDELEKQRDHYKALAEATERLFQSCSGADLDYNGKFYAEYQSLKIQTL